MEGGHHLNLPSYITLCYALFLPAIVLLSVSQPSSPKPNTLLEIYHACIFVICNYIIYNSMPCFIYPAKKTDLQTVVSHISLPSFQFFLIPINKVMCHKHTCQVPGIWMLSIPHQILISPSRVFCIPAHSTSNPQSTHTTHTCSPPTYVSPPTHMSQASM